VKIDEEMRPWECPQTDRHTHTCTDAKWFYYLSHAICYSCGADKKHATHTTNYKMLCCHRWTARGSASNENLFKSVIDRW